MSSSSKASTAIHDFLLSAQLGLKAADALLIATHLLQVKTCFVESIYYFILFIVPFITFSDGTSFTTKGRLACSPEQRRWPKIGQQWILNILTGTYEANSAHSSGNDRSGLEL